MSADCSSEAEAAATRDRGRVARGALRVPEPKQVALERRHARLQAIITRRPAPARRTRPRQQRAHHQAPRLGRQRLARRPIPTTRRPTSPTTCGWAIQRHRQRPKTPRQQTALRPRADARGTAETDLINRARPASGTTTASPGKRGWRSVRDAATVRTTFICGADPEGGALSGRKAADGDRAGTRSSSVRERAEVARGSRSHRGRQACSAWLQPASLEAVAGAALEASRRRSPAAAVGAPPSPFRHRFTRERCESLLSAA